MQTFEVRLCDVLIIGMGIAGVAIAEKLAREAWRQGRRIRIILVDEADGPGSGASGGLEGWYHRGFLYALNDDKSLIFTFIHSAEDMYNWYTYDPLFRRPTPNCNFWDVSGNGAPEFDFCSHNPEAWFVSSLPYIVTEPAVGISSSGRHGIEEALGRAAGCFVTDNWEDSRFGCCAAPHRMQQTPCDSSAWAQILGEPAGDEGQQLGEIVRRLNQREPATIATAVSSPDAVMNPWRILTDLMASAARLGVQVLPGYKLDAESVELSSCGPADTVQSVFFTRSDAGPSLQVIADQFIFALGAGYQSDLLRDRLNVRVNVQKRSSVMLVAEPALSPVSFVRLDSSPAHTFNHLCRRWSNSPERTYSIIADANALTANATREECATATRALLKKAAIYFGSRLNDVSVQGYSCIKAEIPSTAADRSYSYWLGPVSRDWTSPEWHDAAARHGRQAAEDAIRAMVVRGDFDANCGGIGVVSDSSWAAKKALHFALMQLVTAMRKGDSQAIDDARRIFFTFQARVSDCFSTVLNANRHECGEPDSQSMLDASCAKPNFLCVVPGKFSLFPTLAHGVYLELESRGMYRSLPLGLTPSGPSISVATPRSEEVLAATHNSFSELVSMATQGR